MLLLFQNDNFNNVLEKLDFSINSDITGGFPEIVFLNKIPKSLHPKQYLELEFAKALEADAVYFKYYDDNRFCTPQVYFYDNSKVEKNKENIAEIHRNIYSNNQVSLMVVVDNNSITLFDTKKPVKSSKNGLSNKHCKIQKSFSLENELDILKKFFDAKKLNTGLFWETNEASKHFQKENSAYEKLIDILGQIRTAFVKDFAKNGLKRDFAEDLLFKCILIKYLEENCKENAVEFYRKNKLGYYSLNEILANRKILDLFNALENHFNGKVFEISPRNENGNIDLVEKEKQEEYLRKNDLELLAKHLEGFLDNGSQISLWQEYSFKYMPIELISNFYEQFIPKDVEENKGTVYTPSFLVNFLIDECLPISENENDLNENVKLADVSCGSGIFITTAFKRLVQRLRIKKWIAEGKPEKLPNPTLDEVKNILTNSIYGVDIHPISTKLTKFSLQLALCQIVPSDELWKWNNDKIFADLEDKNIFQKDFFDFLVDHQEMFNSFDLIIGNPPFLSLSNAKYNEYINKLKTIEYSFSIKIPDNQLALMFLEASNVLLKPKGDLCFIQKSTALLYNKGVKEFRDSLFNQFHIHQIIDFTLLKKELYKSKSKTMLDDFGRPLKDNKGKLRKTKVTSVESCALFYKKEKLEEYSTLHIVSRLLKNTKEGLSFEFDYYDFFELSKQQILDDDTIWRCNLLGGKRLNHLIKKLNVENDSQVNFKTFLITILNIDKKSYGEGYMRGKKNLNNSELITSYQNLVAKKFNYKEYELIDIPNDSMFQWTRSEKNLYKTPLLVIKEEITRGNVPIEFFDDEKLEYLPFDSRILGVSFENNKDAISTFNKLKINENLNALKTLATCSQFFLGSSSVIQKADVDNWIIPIKKDEIDLNDDENIIVNDVLNYIYPSWYEGAKSAINNDIATIQHLKKFGEIFSNTYNSIYKIENKEQFISKIIIGDDFYALVFYYSDKISETKLINSEQEIDLLLKDEISRNGNVNRVIKRYDENTITLIKPKTFRYWLKSVALRDIDDVFDDIIENGLR